MRKRLLVAVVLLIATTYSAQAQKSCGQCFQYLDGAFCSMSDGAFADVACALKREQFDQCRKSCAPGPGGGGDTIKGEPRKRYLLDYLLETGPSCTVTSIADVNKCVAN